MPIEVSCSCTLCEIEARLFSELAPIDAHITHRLFSVFTAEVRESSVTQLLSHLRAAPADATSDDIFRELFAMQETSPCFAESLLVLVFLPMLHRTIRLVARQQEHLAEEDITQQALCFLLGFLRSDELRARRSHYAFAVSRDVKRHVFEWAKRENRKLAMLDHPNEEWPASLAVEDSFERHAFLRHFLHRNVTKGLLTDSEIDLLIQFKMDGNSGVELAALNGSSSNAVRQRFKRLLSKLRRLAL